MIELLNQKNESLLLVKFNHSIDKLNVFKPFNGFVKEGEAE